MDPRVCVRCLSQSDVRSTNHIIHALLTSNVVRANMLIRPGKTKKGNWIGVDENIEMKLGVLDVSYRCIFQRDTDLNAHMLQTLFTARGVRSSWDRLGTISPGVHIWADIAKQLSSVVGVSYRSTTHVDPDTSSLVSKVAKKAQEWFLLTPHPMRPARKVTGGLTKDCLGEGESDLNPDKRETQGSLAAFHRGIAASILMGEVMTGEVDSMHSSESAQPDTAAESLNDHAEEDNDTDVMYN